jgi:hypothetical protein
MLIITGINFFNLTSKHDNNNNTVRTIKLNSRQLMKIRLLLTIFENKINKFQKKITDYFKK